MKRFSRLVVVLLVVAVAVPAQAKKKDRPPTLREALAEAPLFADAYVQDRGQRLLDQACAAVLDRPEVVCDLVIKDVELEGFYFKPESGVMLTSIEMLDTLKDDELRAGFAWAVAYADGGLRAKAARLQKERLDLLRALGMVNPSVGVGSVRSSGNAAVSVGFGLSPAMVLAIVAGLAGAVEDARLAQDLSALDAEVEDRLHDAGFEDAGLLRLLKRAQKEGDYLLDRETGIGRVDQNRIKKVRGQ